MTWRVGVALALLVVLAGCSGAVPAVGDGDRSPATPTPTATPAPVPDLTPTPTRTIPPIGGPTVTAGGELAPGVTTDGVVDAVGLGEAHRGVLANRSLTVDRRVLVRYPNGTEVQLNETVRLSADRWRLRSVTTMGETRYDRYAGRYDLSRVERDGEVRYDGGLRGVTTGGPFPLRTAYRRSFLGLLVGADDARVTRVEGAADYRVTATFDTLRESESPFGLDPDPGTISLYVREDGLVYGWDLRYTARTREGTPVAVTTRVRHVEVGSTTVERPPWYDEAVAAAGLNATGTPQQ